MAKSSKSSDQIIKELLEERTRLEAWLAKLDAAGDKTPAEVRGKVESDYRTRLDKVVSRLGEFVGDMEESLAAQRSMVESLSAEKQAAEERLAEAELRHTVGEFTDSQFEKVQSEVTGQVQKIDTDLNAAEAEIDRLTEVLAVARKEPEPTPAAPIEELTVPDAVGGEEQGEVVGRPSGSTVAVDESDLEGAGKSAGRQDSGQTNAFDELAFLKSVTEDEEQGPSAARASGGLRIPDEVLQGAGSGAGEVAQQAPERSKSGAVKTLKCQECGTLNLPTEWYCERCGAELAAL